MRDKTLTELGSLSSLIIWRTETEAFQLLFRRRIDPLLSAIPESAVCPALLSPLCHQRRNTVFLLHNFDILSFLLVSMNAVAFQAGIVPLFVSFHGFECVRDSMGTDILSR